ncbi:MAG: cell division protein FtsB [Gammaproteobacteria bacterium]|nr:cell division protein FtsB [Gammaproteobacteria bacterium]
MQKISIIVLLILLALLQYRLWFGKGSLEEQRHLQQLAASQKEEIAQLRARNAKLAAEVADLKQGLEAVEEHARLELGMIKKGESFYRIVDE